MFLMKSDVNKLPRPPSGDGANGGMFKEGSHQEHNVVQELDDISIL